MYWLTGALSLLIMLGVLSAAEMVAVPLMPSWLMTLASSHLLLLFLCMGAVLFCQQLAKRHFILLQTSASKTPQSLWSHFRLTGLALLLIIGSAIQALAHKQSADEHDITAPMQVYAVVQLDGISDSVGGSSTDRGYRQVARIHRMMPVTDAPHPLNSENAQAIVSALSEPDTSLSTVNSDDAPRVLLSYYPKLEDAASDTHMQRLNALRPNDTLIMRLMVQPLDAKTVSATGFDSYQWLKSRHINGTAKVIDSSGVLPQDMDTTSSLASRMSATIDNWRWTLRQYRYLGWTDKSPAEQQATAVGLSLLTGDRSLITHDTKDLYQLAGISHLLAISGTHVLFLAIVLAGAASMLIARVCPQLYQRLARWQVRWLVMIGAAFVYALFTGFDVPAARTAWLLLVVGMVRLTLLPISTMRVLLALAVLMAWADPVVLWQAGYWLSFVAVALLLQYESRRQYVDDNQAPDASLMQRCWHTLLSVIRLQCCLFVALLPLTLLLFGKISLWGLLVNVVMIGLFGWVLVPLNLLAGVLYPIIPTLADSLWSVLDTLLLWVHGFMGMLADASASSVWLYTPLTVGGLCVAALVLLPWLLPRGFLHRGWSAPPLLLLVFILAQQQTRLIGAPVLYVLPLADNKLSAVLLHYPQASTQATWLILADHRDRAARMLPSHVRQKALTQQLSTQIQALGVTRLTGIIVQTPNTMPKNSQEDSTLQLSGVAQDIATRLPTQYYWQAGKIDSTSATINHQPNTLPITPCQANQTWQLPNNALTITALTGWTMIDDDAVWDCNLSIRSHEPITLKRYNAQDNARPLELLSANHGAQSIAAQTHILIDASTQPKVWQLWSLLCPDVNNKAATDTMAEMLWLGHSSTSISTELLQHHSTSAVATYDGAPLPAAWSLPAEPSSSK